MATEALGGACPAVGGTSVGGVPVTTEPAVWPITREIAEVALRRGLPVLYDPRWPDRGAEHGAGAVPGR